jgi:putative ABC transport system ATP-binding protein
MSRQGNLDGVNGQAIMDLLFGLRDRHGATLVHGHPFARTGSALRPGHPHLRDGRIEERLAEAAE